MTNEFGQAGQLDVEISNLYASDAEIEKLQTLLDQGLAGIASPLVITAVSNNAKGTRYAVTCRVFEPKRFQQARVQDWPYEAKLVGWRLEVTTVRP